MTTIDSDSESQDSDDGRRFRFEATRKDDTLRLQNQNKRRSPLSKRSNYRSRSTDRGNNHNRRDYDKRKQDRDRKEGSDRDKRKSSKDRDSRDNKYDSKSNSKESRHAAKGNLKDTKEAQESKASVDNEKRCSDSKASNHRDTKDYRNAKDSRSRESKNSSTRALKDTKIREVKDAKDQDLKSPRDRERKTSRDVETKDSRDRERGPKRSRDMSHDRLSGAKHSHRSREKYKSRERIDNREKSKQLDGEKATEERSKIPERNKIPRKRLEGKTIKRDTHSPSKILEQIGSDTESDLGALDPDVGPVMALDTFEDCREMNLSDFDIISDTEGSSSSDTPKIKSPVEGPIIKGEILAPHYYGPKITKRVSRRQYERLVRRQAALNTRRLEELYKVNPGNNDNIVQLAPSNNNPSAVSDFLLGPEAVGEHRGSRIKEQETSEDSREDQESEDQYKLKENPDQDSRKLHNLKIEKLSLANSNHKEKNASATEIYKQREFSDKEIYGPSLPPKCEKEIAIRAAETVVNKNREVVSFSRDAGSSSSFDRTSSISSKKSNARKKKRDNSDKSTPSDVESRNAVIGPSLPPGFGIDSESQKSESEESSSSNNRPEEKSAPIIGPSLPPHLQRENSNSVTSKAQDSTQPQNNSVSSRKPSVFGPTLPPHLMSKVSENTGEKSDSDSEDGFLGPLPADHPAAMNDYIQQQLEERARRMKNKLDSMDSVVEKREEWMLELPSAQAANLGLDKRQFRNKAGPDMSDRSSWTDTPADRAKKREDRLLGKLKTGDPAKESEKLAIQERDRAMEKMAEKHASKKRKESLLEIHKKKLHKKKKKEAKEAKEAGKPMRRPFDRDVDLQANRFDEAQKKSILNKAQLLNDRFSRGESKFL